MTIQSREASKIFTPLALGDGTVTLKHRMYIFPLLVKLTINISVMAPLTRRRSPGNVPTPVVGEYYEQRASEGGLLITEGVLISPMVFNNVSITDKYLNRREIILTFLEYGRRNKLKHGSQS